MKTKPFTEAHAISGFELAWILGHPLTDDALVRLQLVLAADKQLMADFATCVSESESNSNDRHVILKSDAEVDVAYEVMVFRHGLRVFFSDYRGWTATKKLGRRWADLVLPYVFREGGILVSCGVACTDVFIREGVDGYSYTEVFREGSGYLPDWVKRATPSWRLRSTWHDKSGYEGGNLFVRLDMTAKLSASSTFPEVHTTTIDHRQQTMPDPEQKAPAVSVDWTFAAFDVLHAQNKRTVKEMIQPSLAEVIGL